MMLLILLLIKILLIWLIFYINLKYILLIKTDVLIDMVKSMVILVFFHMIWFGNKMFLFSFLLTIFIIIDYKIYIYNQFVNTSLFYSDEPKGSAGQRPLRGGLVSPTNYTSLFTHHCLHIIVYTLLFTHYCLHIIVFTLLFTHYCLHIIVYTLLFIHYCFHLTNLRFGRPKAATRRAC